MGSQDSVVVDSDSCDGENVEITKKKRECGNNKEKETEQTKKQVIQQHTHVQMSIET